MAGSHKEALTEREKHKQELELSSKYCVVHVIGGWTKLRMVPKYGFLGALISQADSLK